MFYDGDGRNRIEVDRSCVTTPIQNPVSVTKKTAKELCSRFLKSGRYHSATGGLLWVHIKMCKEMGLNYEVEEHRQRISHSTNFYSWTITLKAKDKES